MEKEIIYLENMLKNIKCHLPSVINPPIYKNLENAQTYIKTQVNDIFFHNSAEKAKKIKEIPDFLKRFHTVIKTNLIKIGDIREEQPHLEYYDKIETQNIPQYILATYHYNPDNYNNFDNFFSLLLREQSFKPFFHFLLDSYFYLLDSLILLNKKGLYVIYLKEYNIFFNEYNRPILSCMDKIIDIHKDELKNLIIEDKSLFPVEFLVLDYLNREKKPVFLYSDLDKDFDLKKDLFATFINKTPNQIVEHIINNSLKTLNNYQLCLLYLNQLDKIMDDYYPLKFEEPIHKMYEILTKNQGLSLTEMREIMVSGLFS